MASMAQAVMGELGAKLQPAETEDSEVDTGDDCIHILYEVSAKPHLLVLT